VNTLSNTALIVNKLRLIASIGITSLCTSCIASSIIKTNIAITADATANEIITCLLDNFSRAFFTSGKSIQVLSPAYNKTIPKLENNPLLPYSISPTFAARGRVTKTSVNKTNIMMYLLNWISLSNPNNTITIHNPKATSPVIIPPSDTTPAVIATKNTKYTGMNIHLGGLNPLSHNQSTSPQITTNINPIINAIKIGWTLDDPKKPDNSAPVANPAPIIELTTKNIKLIIAPLLDKFLQGTCFALPFRFCLLPNYYA